MAFHTPTYKTTAPTLRTTTLLTGPSRVGMSDFERLLRQPRRQYRPTTIPGVMGQGPRQARALAKIARILMNIPSEVEVRENRQGEWLGVAGFIGYTKRRTYNPTYAGWQGAQVVYEGGVLSSDSKGPLDNYPGETFNMNSRHAPHWQWILPPPAKKVDVVDGSKAYAHVSRMYNLTGQASWAENYLETWSRNATGPYGQGFVYTPIETVGRMGYRVVPDLSIRWDWRRGGGPRPPDLNVNGRPPPGVKETKVRMTAVQAFIWYRLNDVAGLEEATVMFYEASDGVGADNPIEMFEYLFLQGGIYTVDWIELGELIAYNEIEDRFYGKLGELTAAASQGLGRPVGVGVGFAM